MSDVYAWLMFMFVRFAVVLLDLFLFGAAIRILLRRKDIHTTLAVCVCFRLVTRLGVCWLNFFELTIFCCAVKVKKSLMTPGYGFLNQGQTRLA